jgi:plastocyanin
MTRLALVGMTVLLAACGASAAPPSAAQAEVTIANYHFIPATLTIAAGTTVTWTNKDEDAHTVMDAAGAFRSGALDEGQSFTFMFAKPGLYRIACSMHPQMSETILVE